MWKLSTSEFDSTCIERLQGLFGVLSARATAASFPIVSGLKSMILPQKTTSTTTLVLKQVESRNINSISYRSIVIICFAY